MNSVSELNNHISELSRQFKCNLPLRELTWHAGFTDWDVQEQLIRTTIYCERNRSHPIKLSYQKAFLKWFVQQLQPNHDINDIVYEALGNIVSQSEDTNSKCYKHYNAGNVLITLSENVQIISEGTTGLNTWQAALVLAEWSLANRDLLAGETIVELGAGLGLVGLTIALNCPNTHVVLTDCHHKVLAQLQDNITLNLNLNKSSYSDVSSNFLLSKRMQHSDGSSSIISVLEHAWNETKPETVETLGARIILAADVVYDSSLFADLITCITLFLSRPNTRMILICTQRNITTLEQFLTLLEDKCNVEEGQVPDQKYFAWSTAVAIRLFVVTSK